MSQSPGKLSLFWKELKRRKVLRSLAIYAGTAFIILEASTIIFPRWNLPEWSIDLVLYLLIFGAFINVIIAWFYDITSEGIQKTLPVEETTREERILDSRGWKVATYISLLVIAALVLFNVVGSTKQLKAGDIQSLAILPFDNYTGDDQLDWVAAGMHSSLIGDMGKVTGLRVLGQTTSNAYKETDLTATEIAKKHNVDALIEATLTCYGEMVCMQVRVITPYPEEKVLWTEEYMEDRSQILNLNNRMTRKIAAELKISLSQEAEFMLAETRTIDPDAFDAYLRGRYLLDQFHPRSFQEAIESFVKASEIEPEWAAPHAGIAEVGAYQRQMGIASEADIIRMYEHLNKALELNPHSVESHHANAVIAVWTEFDWEKGEREFIKALELNPSFERSHSFYAHLLTILRRTDEALHHGKIAQELDPENPFTLGLYWAVLMPAGKCQEALYYLEKALSIDPDHYFLRGKTMPNYLCLEEYEKAFELWKQGNITMWEKYGVTEVLEKTFHEKGWIAFIRELKGINEGVMAEEIGERMPSVLFERHVLLGEYEQAMDYLDKWYHSDSKNPSWPYFANRDYYDRFKDEPRYLAILKEMNLPVD